MNPPISPPSAPPQAASPGRFRGGLLFDIDGTLADTDAFHLAAFNRLLEPWGQRLDKAEYSTRVMGRTNPAIMADLFPGADAAFHAAQANAKEDLFRALVRDEIRPMPGLMALLDWCEAQGIARAVVTNAPRANAELILGALGIQARFGALVIGDEIAHGKPHPLPYLTGAARIGVDPAQSIAFEDSRSGIASAKAAGAFVFGLTSSFGPEALREAGADAVLADFQGTALRMAILARLSGET